MAFSEAEQLACAIDYLQKLAGGVHPITGEMLLDSKKLEDKRLMRLFSYCERVISAYVELKRASGKFGGEPFRITREQKMAVEISVTPVAISVFVAKINAITDENVERLRTRKVTGWLLDNGFLKTETINGQAYRVPSELAAAIGISTRSYSKGDQTYPLNVYDEYAQRFILKHLEDIVAGRKLELDKIKEKIDVEGNE